MYCVPTTMRMETGRCMQRPYSHADEKTFYLFVCWQKNNTFAENGKIR